MGRIARVVGVVCVMAVFAVGCSTENTPTSSISGEGGALNRAPIDSGVAALGDLVWNDVDMDGVQGDPSLEPGIEGVTVFLLDCDGNALDTTVTDGDGFYCFADLMFGDSALSYTVLFVLPTADDGAGPKTDVVSPLLPIWLGTTGGAQSLEVSDDTTAYEVLCQNVYGKPNNGITKLYAQLLAAKLNVLSGADATDIQATIDAADAFLADNGYDGWKQLDKDQKDSVQAWHNMLDDYNNGIIGPGTCQNEWVFSDANAGGDGMLDSDADPGTGLTGCYAFADPVYNSDVDAGMYLVIDTDCTRGKGFWKNRIFVD